MKKYIDILTEIDENSKKQEAAKTRREQAQQAFNIWYDGLNFKDRKKKKEANPEEAERLINAISEAEAEETRINKIAAILNDNARAAFTAENLPAIIEVINKYTGKKIGEKTREKICAEIETATGCGFWFASDFGSITFYDKTRENCGICWCAYETTLYISYSKRDQLFDENGKFTSLTLDDLPIYQKYFDDPAAAVDKAEALKKEIEAEAEKINNLIAEYTKTTPSTAAHPGRIWIRF